MSVDIKASRTHSHMYVLKLAVDCRYLFDDMNSKASVNVVLLIQEVQKKRGWKVFF
jgi:hypothetical protein